MRYQEYKIIVVVNDLEEFKTQFNSRKSELSINKIPARNFIFSLKREDLFIGSSARLDDFLNRIGDYRHLSYLKNGRLTIEYYSDFDALTKHYNTTKYVHFFDQCIKQKLINLELESFNNGFKTRFLRFPIKDLQENQLKIIQNKPNTSLSKKLGLVEKVNQLKIA